MIQIGLKSEYSFKQAYSPINDLVQYAVDNGMSSIGIADMSNTFGHYHFAKACEKAGIKPIFGVRLNTLPDSSKQRTCHIPWVYVAKNDAGLVELYGLVKKAYDRFYYVPKILFSDLLSVSDNIAILSPYRIEKDTIRADLEPSTLDFLGGLTFYNIREKKTIPMVQSRYITTDQKPVYQLMAGVQKRGTEYIQQFDQKTYSQHIWNDMEYLHEGGDPEAIEYSKQLADECNASLPKAPMIKYNKGGDLRDICKRLAVKRGIDLNNKVYAERFDRELSLILDRDFQDYFLIVADILNVQKRKGVLIGPARGSSGGSLVCYMLGITELDPIEHELLFERFIDVNRFDLPDIDTDIPDTARQDVIKYIKGTYGANNVAAIGTILRYKPKSAIDEFAKSLGVSKTEIEDVKASIIERSGGDARASMCIMDTFDGTETGKQFIEAYPNMALAQYAEGHANHYGKHAAGIIIANEPLDNYCGVNTRDGIIMMEGKPAELIGLLKVDVLGLRTLSIVEDTAKLAGIEPQSFYKLGLDDTDTFRIFNDGRMQGVFQFEGKALGILTKQMGVADFNDICAITALARPGALNSGGAAKYVKRYNGAEEYDKLGGIFDDVTENTHGIVLYQEQAMSILRNYGNLSWDDVGTLRNAMKKSYGDEFFSGYKEKFVKGALENDYTEASANDVWETVASMGSYGFNKSHAVAYSMISYWTAYCKAHYPLEFAAANLNHAKDGDSAIRLLRDFVVNDNIEYVSVDPDVSGVNWTIYDGKLIGGLTNMDGIGEKKAKEIIKKRNEGCDFTPAILKKMLNPETPFDILFPTQHYYGHLYEDPISYGLDESPSKIIDAQDAGEYTIIGKVFERDLRDRNDVQSVMKRGNKVKEHQYYLNLFIEDDTDDIKCTIPPFLFDELNGQGIAESIKLGVTYLLIRGRLRDGWRNISISAIHDVTDMKRNV
jgi:DNA polymerase III alpha subunit